LPGKIEIIRQFSWKNPNFLSTCLEKPKFFPGKIDIFQKICLEKSIFFKTWIHDPQVSNQIDAAEDKGNRGRSITKHEKVLENAKRWHLHKHLGSRAHCQNLHYPVAKFYFRRKTLFLFL